jgi:general secretion pathway protein K
VLWGVAMLAMLAAALQELTVSSWRLEARAEHAAFAEAALDAAVNRAVTGISDPQMERRWRVDGVPRDFAFAGAAIRVTVQDDQGFINLNTADASLIRQLLKTGGMTDDDAAALTDKILDWRSKEYVPRLHGVTDAEYRARGYAYRQRHGPFQTVDELKLVMGMTPDLFARIAPALTVHGISPVPDPTTAPRTALLALKNDDHAFVDAWLARRTRERITPDDLPSPVPPGVVDPMAPLAGRSFTITAEVIIDRRTFVRQADVEFSDKQPYFLLDWR